MLDRARLLSQLQHAVDTLFSDNTAEREQVYQAWMELSKDPLFVHKIRRVEAPWPIPSWSGSVNEAFSINTITSPYRVLSVDGSQVYPDRHQSLSCYLINIGSVIINYGCKGAAVVLDSSPHLFVGDDGESEVFQSTDLINCKRQELEFQVGLEVSRTLQDSTCPLLLLFDGSLIFWHLEAKDMSLRDYFLPRYLATLHQLSLMKIPIAGYVSLPKSKELINLVRLQLSDFKPEKIQTYECTNRFVDAHIADFFLEPGQRSRVFQNNSSISQLYPDHIRPHFFYIRGEVEMGRVEIPAWIAADSARVDMIASMVLDQITKGSGYPIVIAEAHEQAVIKGPDRDFFYYMISKLAFEHKKRPTLSSKLARKRFMGV